MCSIKGAGCEIVQSRCDTIDDILLYIIRACTTHEGRSNKKII